MGRYIFLGVLLLGGICGGTLLWAEDDSPRCLACEELKGEYLLEYSRVEKEMALELEAGRMSVSWAAWRLADCEVRLTERKVAADLMERAVRDDFAGVEVGLQKLVASGVMELQKATAYLEAYREKMVVRLASERRVARKAWGKRERAYLKREAKLRGLVRAGKMNEVKAQETLAELWSALRGQGIGR